MRVKCIANERKWLRNIYVFDERETEIYYTGFKPDDDYTYPFTIGKEYVVYAMAINCESIWYFICRDDFEGCPILAPALLFDVVDNRLSKYWVYSHGTGKNFIRPQTTWAFSEWAEDPDFFIKLSDGYERERELFIAYKTLLDAEFTDKVNHEL